MPKSITPNQFDYAGVYVEGTRSNFRFKKPVAASFMSGMLVPCGDPIRVFPGTKLDLKLEGRIRGNTMVCPPLDSMYVDFFAVFVPDRIVWNHQPQFLGENDQSAWTQSQEYIYPYITYQQANLSIEKFGISDDFGTALGNYSLINHYGLANTALDAVLYNLKISVISARGYYAIWNHFFRDENWQRPVLFSKGDTGHSGEMGYVLRDYLVNSSRDGLSVVESNIDDSSLNFFLMPVNKFHDAFTSLLPQPQFDDGTGVLLPLGDTAPIIVKATSDSGAVGTGAFSIGRTSPIPTVLSLGQTDTVGIGASSSSVSNRAPLYADLSEATSATINQLRTAVMYQRYLEALARGGRRVVEFYQCIYSVKNTNAAKDYPEMLSRSRYILGVNQVVATADASGDDWTSHLGDTGAYSLTDLRGVPICERDFNEFGYLHILYCVRAENRYSQMIPEHFLRSTLLDEYNPFFDHIGDVGVPNYLVNNTVKAINNFGFGEAWWFERTQLAMATGALNKHYGSLKWWTISEEFDSSLTQCTPEFLTFNAAVLDDIFVSNYYTYPQFIGDFLIHGVKSARMSQHSIPGITGRI